MIIFDNWVIRAEQDVPVRQFDNGAAVLKVTGSLPENWDWVMLVRNGKNMDILPLEKMEGGIGAVLTEERLAVSGFYCFQLKGKQGETVRHTNMVTIYVEPSLSGNVQWPTVPSEFSEMERRVAQKTAQAESYALHPPVIGENGNWWIWNGERYTDTGKPSRGEAYEMNEADKQLMVEAVLAAMPNGDEVSY